MFSPTALSRVGAAVAFASIVRIDVTCAQEQLPPQAQTPGQHQHAGGSPDDDQQSHTQMARESSGTAWQPDITPMYAIHWQRGPWQLMAHQNVFVQFLRDAGPRGAHQSGSINWIMGMAQRNAGSGRLVFRGMFSAEPWTIGDCGYPDLLASGERCDGQRIHDRQHPHDLVMEISAAYDAPLKGTLRWQVYGGPAGEPALGPAAFPHRVSAMPNPLAPMSHHWLDSTHITFGVITGGVYASRWKAEASLFNGREPDQRRTDVDFGALDSVSGRVWFLPTPHLAFQVSAGALTEAEVAETGAGVTVVRTTASATYHTAFRENSMWATTMGWGRNEESGHGSNAFLLETSVTFDERDVWFGRFDAASKRPEDLAIAASLDTVAVAKLQGGYTRYFSARRGLKPGVGASVSASFVPAALAATYGGRINTGFGIFVTLRPAVMTMHDGHGAAGAVQTAGAGGSMVMVQTSLDPAKLSCVPAIDPETAPKTTYQGKTYYFCSAKERDEFRTNPAMSLSMMPPKQ
jgi:YHS domain-containing protein